MESAAKKSRRSRSRSSTKDASETRFKIEVTSSNAHQILETLGVSRFGVVCCGDDNPVLRAAAVMPYERADESSSGSLFEKLQLASIKTKRGTLAAGERSIALWRLGELYHRSPIVFKDGIGMSLGEYAFWMRKPVAEVEKIFCQEVINNLMKFVKCDPMWRVWNGMEWVEIDPWKFAVEVDLAGGCAV